MLHQLAIALTTVSALIIAARTQARATEADAAFARSALDMAGGPKLKLLTNKAVQKELALTSDQKDELRAIYREVLEYAKADIARNPPGALSNLSKEERVARLKKDFEAEKAEIAKNNKRIEAILLAEQLERLKQIQVQMMFQTPGFALVDPDVMKELQITEEQKAKIVALNRLAPGMDAMRPGGGLPSAEKMKKLVDANKEREAKIMDVLTAEQKEKLEKMKGRKFDLSLLRGRPGKTGK
jgi:Spy/CpxP family protein refolding chaperone